MSTICPVSVTQQSVLMHASGHVEGGKGGGGLSECSLIKHTPRGFVSRVKHKSIMIASQFFFGFAVKLSFLCIAL